MNEPLISKTIKEPICGWQWVYQHLHDLDGWQPRIELDYGGVKFNMTVKNPEVLRDIIKAMK